MMDQIDRRGFLSRSTQIGLGVAAGASWSVSSRAAESDETPNSKPGPKIGAFTKSFQDRPIPEVCRMFKQIGLDGLDLTVRPRGHIEPENVATELPKAVEAAKQAGTEILFLTTAITEANADAERLLATAAEQGIDRIKLGYYRYKPFGTLAEQLKEIRKQIAGLAKLAGKYKVLPCVHVHSGTFIPSHGTQLYELIRDFAPGEVGAYLDAGHMAKEGGGDGWRQGIDLLAPWIGLVAVKNFSWEVSGRDAKGQQLWRTKTVPIADGICPLPGFIAALKTVGYAGVYSLHSEYKGSHSYKELDTDGCLQQTAVDLKYLRSLL